MHVVVQIHFFSGVKAPHSPGIRRDSWKYPFTHLLSHPADRLQKNSLSVCLLIYIFHPSNSKQTEKDSPQFIHCINIQFLVYAKCLNEYFLLCVVGFACMGCELAELKEVSW